MTALETVKAYYEAFNAKNWEGMLTLVDENIVHEPKNSCNTWMKAMKKP